MTVLLDAGRTWGSEGHEAGEAFPGPNRWRGRGERHVPRTRVAFSTRTADKQRRLRVFMCHTYVGTT